MKTICLILFLSYSLNCLSQLTNFSSCMENCVFNNNELLIFSDSITDTIYLRLTFRNRISEEISYSDLIRASYKKKKNDKYSRSHDIRPKDQTEITDGYINFLYGIMKDCLLKYERFFFKNNTDGIKKLESNHISYYYYNISVIILPVDQK